MVTDYVRQTGVLIDGLERDWHEGRAAGKVGDRQWQNWAAWLAGWRKLQSDFNAPGYPGSFSGGYIDRAKQYRAEYNQWRARLEATGAAVVAPAAPKAIETSSVGRDIAIGLAVVGLSAAVGVLIRGRFR